MDTRLPRKERNLTSIVKLSKLYDELVVKAVLLPLREDLLKMHTEGAINLDTFPEARAFIELVTTLTSFKPSTGTSSRSRIWMPNPVNPSN